MVDEDPNGCSFDRNLKLKKINQTFTAHLTLDDYFKYFYLTNTSHISTAWRIILIYIYIVQTQYVRHFINYESINCIFLADVSHVIES